MGAGEDPDSRRRQVVELFREHVRPGMTLAELARVLDEPEWLRDEDLSVVDVLGGKIPVRWTHEDTVLVLGVLPGLPDDPGWSIYLRVAGRVALADVLALLHGREAPAEVARAEIREIGFEPPDL
jgi:hypothetical protein